MKAGYLNDAALPEAGSHRFRNAILICLLLSTAGAIGWIYYRNHAQSTTQAGQTTGQNRRGQFATTVGTGTAQRQDIPIMLDALGTVTPVATAVVRPQVSGVVTQVLYQEGQMVKRGQALVQIDPAPYQLALNQATGNLQRDTAQLEVAKVTLKRDQTLLAQDSIAQQEVDTEDATVKQLEGTVATDQAAVGTAKLNLAYCRITAPIEGRVGLRPVDVGNYVTPADTSGVATLTQLTPIDVVFAVPSDAIPRIQAHMGKSSTLSATALDRTRATVLEQGSFLTLDNAVDTQTGTVRAKARFANAKLSLFPNQFVNVRLLTDTLKNAVVVPAAAIHHGPQNDYVYVLNDGSTVHTQTITTGPASGDQISITSGLDVGAIVVTEGGDRLTDGATVTVGGRNQSGTASGQRNGNARQRQGEAQKEGQSSDRSGQRRRKRQDNTADAS